MHTNTAHDKHVFVKIPEIVQELVLLLSFRRYDTNQIPLLRTVVHAYSLMGSGP